MRDPGLHGLLFLPLALAFVVQGDSCGHRNKPDSPSAKTSASPSGMPSNTPGAKISNTPSTKSSREVDRMMLEGQWGGQQISMQISDGGALVEFACARGTIEQKIELDEAGRFDVRGTHTTERGGPTRLGVTAREEDGTTTPPQAAGDTKSTAARYGGQVAGESMTLTITLAGAGSPLGTFKLTRGVTPRLMKCL